MATVHANTPRDALSRVENMVNMAEMNLPAKAIRQQICSAISAVVQVSRMPDGKRKLLSLQEITGIEGDVITMQEIFTFTQTGVDETGTIQGYFHATGIRPKFAERLNAACAGFRSSTSLNRMSPDSSSLRSVLATKSPSIQSQRPISARPGRVDGAGIPGPRVTAHSWRRAFSHTSATCASEAQAISTWSRVTPLFRIRRITSSISASGRRHGKGRSRFRTVWRVRLLTLEVRASSLRVRGPSLEVRGGLLEAPVHSADAAPGSNRNARG